MEIRLQLGVLAAVVLLVGGHGEVCRMRELPSNPEEALLLGPCARSLIREPLPPSGPEHRDLGEDDELHTQMKDHRPCPAVMKDAPAMLQALSGASYDCTNKIAGMLGPLADRSVVQKLMNIASDSPDKWTRRNGLRVLGDFCWTGSNCQSVGGAGCTLQKACKLLLHDEKPRFERFLYQRIEKEKNELPLDDALWITSSYFPTIPGLKARYVSISDNSTNPEVTKVRAQQLWNIAVTRQPFLSAEDMKNLLLGLKSDDETTLRQYCASSQYVYAVCDHDQRVSTTAVLQSRFKNMSALMLETQIGIASALDRYTKTSAHMKNLKTGLHTTLLSNMMTSGNVTVYSSLPKQKINCWLALVNREWRAFFHMLGKEFTTPVTNTSSHNHVQLYVFPNQQAYSSYMQAFVGFAQNAGGLYVAARHTLYTYERTAETNYISVEELILHEFGHYLQSRYVLPGTFGVGNYAAEPKGWLDEGLADFWGGLNFNNKGCYSSPLRYNYMKRICRVPFQNWNLQDLLQLRAGYDQGGVFEYKHAYTFAYFMATKNLDVLKKLLHAFRTNSYHFDRWEAITGTTVPHLNEQWHDALDSYCAEYKKPPAQRAPVAAVCPPSMPDDHQSSCSVAGHGYRVDHEMESGELGESEDQRLMHAGTPFQDLLGPEAEASSSTTWMSSLHDDLLDPFELGDN